MDKQLKSQEWAIGNTATYVSVYKQIKTERNVPSKKFLTTALWKHIYKEKS